MKLTERWKQGLQPTISFELFPPRTPQASAKLQQTVQDLVSLKPDFVSVTFGAGGSTRSGSQELLGKLQALGVEVLAYFAGYGLGPDDIREVLDAYQQMGIDNLLVVRGDVPKDQPDFHPHPQSLTHATDLLSLIRPSYPFCLGAAGYPEGHVESSSKETDTKYLKLKVDCGAQFIVANYFYDNDYFFRFLDRCRAADIGVPIIPGVMPIYSVKMMETLAGICGATITKRLREGLAELPDGDKDAVVRFGIRFAYDQCSQLLRAGVPGIHLYTMDRSDCATEIVRQLRANHFIP